MIFRRLSPGWGSQRGNCRNHRDAPVVPGISGPGSVQHGVELGVLIPQVRKQRRLCRQQDLVRLLVGDAGAA